MVTSFLMVRLAWGANLLVKVQYGGLVVPTVSQEQGNPILEDIAHIVLILNEVVPKKRKWKRITKWKRIALTLNVQNAIIILN
ncbi:MAG: hypothetical protein CVV02_06065 [Firmicutes bacterium HGW-Firmicutes-7]|nr:MAG: hypothetical protein CVV02_06065 [Firmicutes bacterium HGW-Firmicutes-7]